MQDKATGGKRACTCPYCDAEVECIGELAAVCQPCSITIITCETCGGKVREGSECPECAGKT